MNEVRVLLFSRAREAAGAAEARVSLERPVTGEDFWAMLVVRFPGLKELAGSTRLARDEQYLLPGELIGPGAEVAVIPAVSGG